MKKMCVVCVAPVYNVLVLCIYRQAHAIVHTCTHIVS